MAVQHSLAVQNARLDVIETTVGTTPIMRIRTGGPPVDCASPDTGTVLSQITLPSDWMAAASGGTKAKQGTWQDAAADASGIAGHFRLYDATGTTCHQQGTVTGVGGGGDMEVSNTNFAAGQPFEVVTYTWTEGNQ